MYLFNTSTYAQTIPCMHGAGQPPRPAPCTHTPRTLYAAPLVVSQGLQLMYAHTPPSSCVHTPNQLHARAHLGAAKSSAAARAGGGAPSSSRISSSAARLSTWYTWAVRGAVLEVTLTRRPGPVTGAGAAVDPDTGNRHQEDRSAHTSLQHPSKSRNTHDAPSHLTPVSRPRSWTRGSRMRCWSPGG